MFRFGEMIEKWWWEQLCDIRKTDGHSSKVVAIIRAWMYGVDVYTVQSSSYCVIVFIIIRFFVIYHSQLKDILGLLASHKMR